MLRRQSAAHRGTVSSAFRAILACGLAGTGAAVPDRAIAQDDRLADQCWASAHMGDDPRGDMGKVIAACTRAIEYGGTSPHGRALAYAYRALARTSVDPFDSHRLELADCKKAIAVDPTVAEGYYVCGMLYGAVDAGPGTQELAIVDLDRAIALNLSPELAPAAYTMRASMHRLRAIHLKDDNELRLAIRDIGEVIRLKPNDPDNYSWRAEVEQQLGDHAAAQNDLVTARGLDGRAQ